MYGDTEEEKILHDLGLKINWNSISNEEWEQMLKRNEKSKQIEDNENKTNEE
jgi:hypothetical protein